MLRGRASWICLTGVLWALPAASDCGAGRAGRPWVSVVFEDTSFPPAGEARMVEDLRAGLSDRAIDVCGADERPARPAVAQIRVAQATETKVGVSVEVRDSVTEKRVARDVDLSAVPKDGRAFAVALAADELLRASWVELAIERARRPKRPPPPEVAAVVESTLPHAERPARAGVRAVAERFLGGQTHLGGDAALLATLVPRLQLEISAGLREALVTSAQDGEVLASAIGAGVMLNYLLLGGDDVEVATGAGGRVAFVRFRGEAEGDATEAELSGLTVYARAGISAAARILTPIWVELGGNLGVPLRTLGARDREDTVTAVSGLELGARVGLAAEF
jgi:hypothetical protein